MRLRDAPDASGTGNLAERMMLYDSNKDGKLTQAEVTDDRLNRLFSLADADGDGTVTRSELNVLMVRERARARGETGGFGGPGDGQRRMAGGPGGGPRGFGGPGGGPPRPGQILPPMLRQRLAISPQQEKEIDALQKEVDARLDKLLTAEQRQQLKEMRAARSRWLWSTSWRRRSARLWPTPGRRWSWWIRPATRRPATR